jgi:hypothetical protein
VTDSRPMRPIPVAAARRIAGEYGYDQVVVVARRRGEPPSGEHVTTYGATRADCAVAARMGDHLKHNVMGWPTGGWRPIDTAPRDNGRLLYLARFDAAGVLRELDHDGGWEVGRESAELPEPYGYWASNRGIEEPTHWAYQEALAPPEAALSAPG